MEWKGNVKNLDYLKVVFDELYGECRETPPTVCKIARHTMKLRCCLFFKILCSFTVHTMVSSSRHFIRNM